MRPKCGKMRIRKRKRKKRGFIRWAGCATTTRGVFCWGWGLVGESFFSDALEIARFDFCVQGSLDGLILV